MFLLPITPKARPQQLLTVAIKYFSISEFPGCVWLRRTKGFNAASFEISDNPIYQDILSGLGYAYGLALTLRLCLTAACKQQRFTLDLKLTMGMYSLASAKGMK